MGDGTGGEPCRDDDEDLSVARGQNTPQNRNIGKTSRYCGYEISSIVLDLAATRSPGGVSVSGFSLHGNVAIPAGDRLFQIPNRIARFRKDWRDLSALENVLEQPLSSDRIKRWKPALDDLCRKTNT